LKPERDTFQVYITLVEGRAHVTLRLLTKEFGRYQEVTVMTVFKHIPLVVKVTFVIENPPILFNLFTCLRMPPDIKLVSFLLDFPAI
jgi:hypothetical protein